MNLVFLIGKFETGVHIPLFKNSRGDVALFFLPSNHLHENSHS